jgi:hypothetical protein
MALPALVHDYEVLSFSVFNCEGPRMNLFCTEELLSCIEHSIPENSLIQKRPGWKKSQNARNSE